MVRPEQGRIGEEEDVRVGIDDPAVVADQLGKEQAEGGAWGESG